MHSPANDNDTMKSIYVITQMMLDRREREHQAELRRRKLERANG